MKRKEMMSNQFGSKLIFLDSITPHQQEDDEDSSETCTKRLSAFIFFSNDFARVEHAGRQRGYARMS